MEKLVKFIEENELKFDGPASGLNSDCTIIAGFADHCGVQTSQEVIDAIIATKKGRSLTAPVMSEVRRVFDFAFTYNYGNWWKTDEAKSTYKF